MNSQSPLAFALPLAALPVAQMQQRMAEQAHAATKRLLSAVSATHLEENSEVISSIQVVVLKIIAPLTPTPLLPMDPSTYCP